MCRICDGPFSPRTDAIRLKAAITAWTLPALLEAHLSGGGDPQPPLIDEEAIAVPLPGAGHHLSPDCAILLRSSTPGAHSDLLSKSQPQPDPPGPPMWESAPSLRGSAFWIRVNSKRAAGSIWNVAYPKQPEPPPEIKQMMLSRKKLCNCYLFYLTC